MQKPSPRTFGLLAGALLTAIVVAAILSSIMHNGFGVPAGSVREGALNVASLVVALLLVAGIGRKKQNNNKP